MTQSATQNVALVDLVQQERNKKSLKLIPSSSVLDGFFALFNKTVNNEKVNIKTTTIAKYVVFLGDLTENENSHAHQN